ncbi:MAG: outer membrane lipoprotein chaperone LolA [SAR86 cluster bacterium]|uniref:Outer-membrane lipoprotein carrier protein n=1 Tax=SAR86 cluster bacterium TaxID=2030880 RepID=A0A972VZC8_9GAMM|nr:outer membrane lipoprotein chaperone LolA [SAR86 cluster bacterium]
MLLNSRWLVLAWMMIAQFALGDSVFEKPQAIDRTAQLIRQLDQLQTLSASFIQTTVNGQQHVVQQARGQLWVSTPGRFRLETLEPAIQTLVSDGETFWSFDSDLEQVIITRLQRDITQVPILLLGGDAKAITDEYQVAYFSEDQHDFFVLEPREGGSLFESLTIVFAADTPVSIVLRDSLGQRTQIELTDVNRNHQIPSATFTLIPPVGADVIDDR